MQYHSLFLDSLNNIDKSWNQFLTKDTIDLIKDIEKNIDLSAKEFTPNADRVLRFFSNSIDDIKIIILGQDPYPQKGVATGRAFEVGTLKTWDDKFNNVSLKNIIRAIYYTYKSEYLKYSEIKKEIGLYFQLKSPDQLFVNWEKQGVLLLNTSFTCQIGKPNSHEKLWYPFTNQLLKYIAKKNSNIIWFIWGNNAKSIIDGVPVKNAIKTMHPMMCYKKEGRDDDFLFGKINCFKETKDLINWLG